jgi:hypothetical protein
MNKHRENLCWIFGNSWSLRFLDEPPAESPAEPPAEPTGYVTVDGKLSDNWPTKLTDTSLHEDKSLPRFKDVEAMAKSYVSLRRQVPLDKTPIPTEHFSDADWEAWHKAGGRPDTAGDYNIQRPDDFPEEHWSGDLMTSAQELFHKIGLSKKQAEAIVNFNNTNVVSQITNAKNDAELEFTKLQDGLVAEWGNAYQQKVHYGNQAVSKGAEDRNGIVDDEFKARLLEKVNKDPDLIKFASNLGSILAEDRLIETPQIPTPMDIQDKITEAMQHPAFMDKTHPQHDSQVEKVLALRRSMVQVKTG